MIDCSEEIQAARGMVRYWKTMERNAWRDVGLVGLMVGLEWALWWWKRDWLYLGLASGLSLVVWMPVERVILCRRAWRFFAAALEMWQRAQLQDNPEDVLEILNRGPVAPK